MFRTLSIRQPWAWLILHGGKDIENRTWSTPVRGRVLIHASKAPVDPEDLGDLFEELYIHMGMEALAERLPEHCEYLRGGIVGSVEIVDCVERSESPWFRGPFGFVLRNPKPLPFIPYRGALGFFEVPKDVRRRR